MDSVTFNGSRRRVVAVVAAWVLVVAAATAVMRAYDDGAGLERAPVCVESPVYESEADTGDRVHAVRGADRADATTRAIVVTASAGEHRRAPRPSPVDCESRTGELRDLLRPGGGSGPMLKMQ